METETSRTFEHSVLTLVMESPLSESDAPKLRGYFGNVYANRPEFHHHRADMSLLYEHPLIQYKVIGGAGIVTGLQKGAYLVKAMKSPPSLLIGRHEVAVMNSSLVTGEIPIGVCNGQRDYQFVKPWLALNQENHIKYEKAAENERSALLQRILVGNLLSMAKAIQLTAKDRIEVELGSLESTEVQVKSIAAIGFTGGFRANFDLPNLWGIGKMTARGFGTIVARGSAND